ncbi:kinase-associated lipoprotein B [Bacillaceae bacterium S4-13-58]
MTISVGQSVKAHYNSGIYIGKVVEDRGERYLVEVLAVHKHPQQGDLHHPLESEGVLFHQRRALAFREKMNVPKNAVHSYEEEIPDFQESLRKAVDKLKEKLLKIENADFRNRALKEIGDLEKSYFK